MLDGWFLISGFLIIVMGLAMINNQVDGSKSQSVELVTNVFLAAGMLIFLHRFLTLAFEGQLTW